MRRNKPYSLVALTVSALLPSLASPARADLKDTTWIRPAMMLLVDTSGSMERKPDTSTAIDQMPRCTNTSTDEKNRWAITLEALTGSFKNYRCTTRDRSDPAFVGQFDYGYFLPHVEFTLVNPGFSTLSEQDTNGVLDTYKTRIKFGLMTFDGVSTTVSGNTLVPWSSFTTVKTKINGVDGQYSYPPNEIANVSPTGTPVGGYGWKPLSFPKCGEVYGVNAGARSAGNGPGSLETVGSSESQSAINTINDNIQSSLLGVRPYGGTPIAGMLDDFRYYLNTNTDVNSSDPYYKCRDRYAILLTDGAPDSLFRGGNFQCDSSDPSCAGGQCQCPYDTEQNLAAALRSQDKLSALWVVAFNVNDAVALASLDKIARAGGDIDAFRATDLDTLRAQLSSLMDKAQPESTSRSVPTIVNNGRAAVFTGITNSGKQYQITAGFKVSQDADQPWEGRLWRQRNECSGASAVMRDIDDTKGDIFHNTLNLRSGTSRNVQTVTPGLLNVSGTLYKSSTIPANVAVVKTNAVTPTGANWSGAYTETDPVLSPSIRASQGLTDVNMTLKPFDATNLSLLYWGTTLKRDSTIDFVRGNSGWRASHKLGDIYHSNPTVLQPLFPGSELLNVFDPQLRGYYQSLLDTTSSTYPAGRYNATYGRPGVVFVATNDGVLHAFNLDDWKDQSNNVRGPGYEFWAFTPPALFSKLPNNEDPSHKFTFDGTPVIKDMMIKRPNSGTATMGTVLVAPVRGVGAYVALDVTFPEAPVFLWQRSFPYLGETVGTPALAHVKVRFNSVDQVRAVAILPGGAGEANGSGSCLMNQWNRGLPLNSAVTSARSSVRCWKMRGRSLYVVDVETGELIQEFDGRHFHSPMTGAVAVDGEALSLSRAAYMTDDDGVLWRLSMIGTDPSQWRVAPLWDLYSGTATNFSGATVTTTSPDWQNGRTASFAPVVYREPITGNISIIVGTGDVDSVTDTNARRVVSISEIRAFDTSSSGELRADTTSVKLNWALQLDAGESVQGPLSVLNDIVYFTSFTGPGIGSDACKIGGSRLVGAHVTKTMSTDGRPQAGLTPASGSGPLVLQYQPDDATNSLLLGLSVTRDPICIQGTAQTDPLTAGSQGRWQQTGQAGGGAFQLRSMVAGKAGTVIGGSTVGGDSGQRQFSRQLPIPSVARSVGWASSIE